MTKGLGVRRSSGVTYFLNTLPRDARYQELVSKFLEAKGIALFGFSRKGNAVGNGLYDKFTPAGMRVILIHPQADEISGKSAFKTVAEVSPPPDAAMICVHPEKALAVVNACLGAGIRLFWFHRSVDNGSFSAEAARAAQEAGADVIPGGCPMMFIRPDLIHRCIKFFIKKSPKMEAAAFMPENVRS